MRTWLIGIGVTILSAALGVGAAYGGSELLKTYAPSIRQAAGSQVSKVQGLEFGSRSRVESGSRMQPGIRSNSGEGVGRGGMRDRSGVRDGQSQGVEIALEDAIQRAETYAARIGADLRLAEVMEFERNYYMVFVEKQTGRGAMEILVDRFGGGTGLEPGPNMMWNLKYGMSMHRFGTVATDNTLSLEEARQAAQQYMETALPGAVLNEGGFSFYGYYTFDYSVNGQTAGMLSVNGLSGQVWPHTWHGKFLSEQEVAQ